MFNLSRIIIIILLIPFYIYPLTTDQDLRSLIIPEPQILNKQKGTLDISVIQYISTDEDFSLVITHLENFFNAELGITLEKVTITKPVLSDFSLNMIRKKF